MPPVCDGSNDSSQPLASLFALPAPFPAPACGLHWREEKSAEGERTLSQHRYRQGKIKREHTIIDGLLPLLEQMARFEAVTSITPGRIRPRSRPGDPAVTFQYVTESGLKLLARSHTAIQEVFIVTSDPETTLARLASAGLIVQEKSGRTRRSRKARPGASSRERSAPAPSPPPPAHASRPRSDRGDAGVKRRRRPMKRRRSGAWEEILERHRRLLALERMLSAAPLYEPERSRDVRSIRGDRGGQSSK